MVPAPGRAGGELHGTVVTRHGDRWTGPIRWDKNENFWDDVLDATKEEEIETRRSSREVKFLGFRISSSGSVGKIRSELAIPMGHIRSIGPTGRDRVEIVLKNGEILRSRESADIGDRMRGIVVEDAATGQVEVEWDAVDRIEFSSGEGEERDRRRLYGTVETRRARFTGFIVWDKDESLLDDILDGEEDGRNYKIPFGKIRKIERRGSRSSEVTLDGGRTVVLRGTNDVDKDNRGIVITIPGIGSVEVSWDEFREVVFTPAPASIRYEEFDGGTRLYGVVRDQDGREYRGRIVWDNDERYGWEPLNGEAVGVEFAILFQNIASIERESNRAAAVELKNGERYVLEGSNDVDRDNKGVIILTDDGEEIRLDWSAFEAVEFR
jgi:hypothetical protein